MNWDDQHAYFLTSDKGGFKLARCLVEGKPVFVLSSPDMSEAEYYSSENEAKSAAENKLG